MLEKNTIICEIIVPHISIDVLIFIKLAKP